MDENQELDPTLTPEFQKDIALIGVDVTRKLDKHFTQWGTGLDYRGLFNGYSYYAKKHGVMLGTVVNALEDAGFIKIYHTPMGKRLIYASNCPLTTSQIEEQMLEQAKK